MITVLGYDGSPLTPRARSALARATLVVGAQRNLDGVPVPAGARAIVLGDVDAALRELTAYDGNALERRAVVLGAGDPGFFGIVRLLRERGLVVEVLPAVSSVAQAFARVGLHWDDALVVSAHGREPRRALHAALAHPKVAVLTGPGLGPADIGSALGSRCRTVVVAERLGAVDERVTRCTPGEAAASEWADPNVVLVLTRAPSAKGWRWPAAPLPGEWALPDAAYAHRDSMISKPEVRALVLARLGPGTGELIWDIGAGCGSVGIECARLGAAVVAVDRDPAAADLVAANASSHGVEVAVVTGSAPGVLAQLPDPDAVFVGGGGAGIATIVTAACRRGPRIVLAAFAALDRVPVAQGALTGAGYHVDGVLLQASRLAPLGAVSRLAAANPVFVVWGRR